MDLEKNARIYAGIPEDSPQDLKYCVMDKKAKYDAFIAGANWQKEQDQSTIELAEDHAMLAGMEKMKEQMMRDTKSGVSTSDNYIQFEDGTWIDLDPTMQLKPAFNIKTGEKVKVLVIKEG